MEQQGWYVIDGNEHLKFNALDDAVAVARARMETESKTVILMPVKEYADYEYKKNKKGKKS